ncbi:MAG: DUF5132 domain-containing protein [Chromatiales bacterium]|jgi:hypothetical protein
MAMNGDTAKGVAIGVGIALLAPVALAGLAGVGRPAARAAVKAGLLMYEKGLETAAELGEILEDLMAEAEAEIEADRADRAAQSEVGDAPSSVAETSAENAAEQA